MLKKIILFTIQSLLVIVSVEANEQAQMYIYDMEVNIQSTKENGKPWDVSGGAPDLKVSVDGEFLTVNQKCRNKYRCTVSFVSNKTSWYFENYDRDLASDDLIGKGNCGLNKRCYLGRSDVMIIRRIK